MIEQKSSLFFCITLYVNNMTRVGQVFKNFQGEEYEIIEYFNNRNSTIKFSSGHIRKNVQYDKMLIGNVKNPYFPSVYGKGYLGEGIFLTSHISYTIWKKMLERCYCENIIIKEK